MAVVNGRAGADFEAAGARDHARLFQSVLSHPFLDGDELIGTLTIYHEQRDPFRDDHRHVLDHVSAQAASVLRNAIAFERLRATAVTDPGSGPPSNATVPWFSIAPHALPSTSPMSSSTSNTPSGTVSAKHVSVFPSIDPLSSPPPWTDGV